EHVSLSVRTLFEEPTLAAFAASVDAAARGPAGRPPILAPAVAGSTHPLSFTQQQLLFFDQLTPGSVTYNAALAIRVRGELDHGLLSSALGSVFERHEALRTVLV